MGLKEWYSLFNLAEWKISCFAPEISSLISKTRLFLCLGLLHPPCPPSLPYNSLPQAGGVMSFYMTLAAWAGGLLSLSHSHRGTDAPVGAGSDGTTTKAAQGVSALVWNPWGDQRIKFHLQGVSANTWCSCTGRGLSNKTHMLQPFGCEKRLLKAMYPCLFTEIFSSCPANWQKLGFGTLSLNREIFGSFQCLAPLCSSGGCKMKFCSSHV